MRKITARWKCVCLLVMLLAVVGVFGSPQKVRAAEEPVVTQTCKVTFANAKGQISSDYYRKLARTVEKGGYIELPKVNRSGYKAVWIAKIDGQQYKYSAGRKIQINQNTKFCLNLYREYTVRFYTANGKKEYTSLRQTIVTGYNAKLPSLSSNENYKFTGWATKAGGKVSKKAGASVKVKSNLKYYAVQQKVTGIKLYKYDGSYWKNVSNSSGTATFPAVNLNSGNMCLGWSRTKGKNKLSNADYKAGDRIPGKSGKYYMVVFGSSMDKAPTTINSAFAYDRVFMVGDSRTVDTKLALGESAPSNVEFIAKGGEGLTWFKSTGYSTLLRSVKSMPKSARKAVVINLGVNDLSSGSAYVTYMKKVATNLKKYNCKMYYMSVNPINSAMVRSSGGKNRTEAQVAAFNKTIYQKLCTGKNKSFTYINTCTNLQTYGWISNRYNAGIYDGLHYSDETYLRIFDYCMRCLNRY
ncbi:InlB B-repeat-containing protein [Blautia sp. MSJ-19]|uniref:InlB B-repeat-containing protein n=1 Tax=Blautia sp. MSJ-19 TaxID=2841517 RepID=UPI001C0EE482|nr:InlB B-repeat-containing protein [Blautia sp. MSJ-19]MBU5482383.1 InlB B-repeat-containing protein [Blautia sp. MSJ-19]